MDFSKLATIFAPYILELIFSKAVPSGKRFIFQQMDQLTDEAKRYLLGLKNKLRQDKNPYNDEAFNLGVSALKGISVKITEVLAEVEAA